MRIYLAARFSRAREMQIIAKRLNALGHSVTSRWIWRGDGTGDDCASHDHAEFCAMQDLHDLKIADTCISFTEAPGVQSRNRGGRHVEFGISQALGHAQIVIGPRENVFHYLPDIKCFDTFERFIIHLALNTQREQRTAEAQRVVDVVRRSFDD
jgi:hypothetical protein